MRCSRPKAVGRRSLAGDQLRAILGAIAIYRIRSCAFLTILTYQPTLPASRPSGRDADAATISAITNSRK
jgi:hypothetical protein